MQGGVALKLPNNSKLKMVEMLAKLYRQSTNRQSLRNVRDLLDALANSIDAHLKRARKSQNGKRSSREEIEACEALFVTVIDNNPMVAVAVQAALSRISKGVRKVSEEKLQPKETGAIMVDCFSALMGIGDSVDPKWIREKGKAMLRGKGGRHGDVDLQAVYRQASTMAQQGRSYDLIARELLPKKYAADRKKARQCVKSGVYRERKKQSLKPSSIS